MSYAEIFTHNGKEYRTEFGCTEQVEFLTEDQVKVTDESGNDVKCSKCGKKATSSISSKNNSIDYCSSCMGDLSFSP